MAPYLRRHEVLPGEAVVIKGGLIHSASKLADDALDCFAKLQAQGEDPVYGVSVCSLPNRTAHEIARIAGTSRLPQAKMRVSSVEALELNGYEVVPSGWRGHATLVFPDRPTKQDWENLQQSFGDPVDNPVAKRAQNA